jgi:predicted transcriptional regulator
MTLQLAPDQAAWLELLADRTGQTIASVIRMAIDEYRLLREEREAQLDRRLEEGQRGDWRKAIEEGEP